jgi:soluble lytic murein transglycosylase-like protein
MRDGAARSVLAWVLGTGALSAGCAREALPLPADPSLFPGPPSGVLSVPARIPAPVPPYVWPDPMTPLGNVAVPYWAGSAAAPYAAAVKRAATYYQLPAELIWAVIKVESNFREQVVSRSGACGLMQLMPTTARSFGVQDALDPEQNILGGAYYLRSLANRFAGDLNFTLAAYNAGPVAVLRYGGVPPFPETTNYVRKVLWYYWNAAPVAL